MNFSQSYIKEHTQLETMITDAITSLFNYLAEKYQDESVQTWLKAQQEKLPSLFEDLKNKHIEFPRARELIKKQFTESDNEALKDDILLLKKLYLKYFCAQQLLSLPNNNKHSSISSQHVQMLARQIQSYGTAIDKSQCVTKQEEIFTKNAYLSNIVKVKQKNKETLAQRLADDHVKKSIGDLQKTLSNSIKNLTPWANPAINVQAFTTLFSEAAQTVDLSNENLTIEMLNTHLTELRTLQTTLSSHTPNFDIPISPAQAAVEKIQTDAEALQELLNKLVHEAFSLNQNENEHFETCEKLRYELERLITSKQSELKNKNAALTTLEENATYKVKDEIIRAYKTLMQYLQAVTLPEMKPEPTATPPQQDQSMLEKGRNLFFGAKSTPETTPVVTPLNTLINNLKAIQETTQRLDAFVTATPDNWFSDYVTDATIPNQTTPWDAMPESRGKISSDAVALNTMLAGVTSHAQTHQRLLQAATNPNANPAFQLQESLNTLVAEAKAHTRAFEAKVANIHTASENFAALNQTLQVRIDETEKAIVNFAIGDLALDNQITAQLLQLKALEDQINAEPNKAQRLKVLLENNPGLTYAPAKIEARLLALKAQNTVKNRDKLPALRKDVDNEASWFDELHKRITDPRYSLMISKTSTSLTTVGHSKRKSILTGLVVGAVIAAILIIATLTAFFTGGLSLAAMIPLVILSATIPTGISTLVGRAIWRTRHPESSAGSSAQPVIEMKRAGTPTQQTSPVVQQPTASPTLPEARQGSPKTIDGNSSLTQSGLSFFNGSNKANPEDNLETNLDASGSSLSLASSRG